MKVLRCLYFIQICAEPILLCLHWCYLQQICTAQLLSMLSLTNSCKNISCKSWISNDYLKWQTNTLESVKCKKLRSWDEHLRHKRKLSLLWIYKRNLQLEASFASMIIFISSSIFVLLLKSRTGTTLFKLNVTAGTKT